MFICFCWLPPAYSFAATAPLECNGFNECNECMYAAEAAAPEHLWPPQSLLLARLPSSRSIFRFLLLLLLLQSAAASSSLPSHLLTSLSHESTSAGRPHTYSLRRFNDNSLSHESSASTIGRFSSWVNRQQAAEECTRPVQVENTEELLREFEAKYMAIRRICMTRAAAGAAGGPIAAHDGHAALAVDVSGPDASHDVASSARNV